MLDLSAFGKNEIRGIYGENITEELFETEHCLKNLYAKSSEIRAKLLIKYFKHQLNEYLNDYKVVT